MRSEILLLLAASYLAEAVPIPFLERLQLSPRWFQDTAPVSLIPRAAPTSTADITFVNPSGSPLATVAASQLDNSQAAQISAAPNSFQSLAPNAAASNGSSVAASSTAPSGTMVGIVPAVGNGAGSPPLTTFPAVALPAAGTSHASPIRNSTSVAQAITSSTPTAASQSFPSGNGTMVGIVPAVPNGDGSPPLTAFPSVSTPAANPKISPAPATSNGTSTKVPSPGIASLLTTTVMITITHTRTRSGSSGNSMANSTAVAATPIPNPAQVTSSSTRKLNSTAIAITPAPKPAQATTSGSSGDTFPLVSSKPPATPAPSPSPSPKDSMRDTFGLGPTTTSPSTVPSPTLTQAKTTLSFSISSPASSSAMLILPSVLTVSPTTSPLTTLTIAPPNAATLAAGSPTSVSTTAPAGLTIIPLNTPGPSGTGPRTGEGTGAKTGGVVTVTQTVALITQTVLVASSTVTVTV